MPASVQPTTLRVMSPQAPDVVSPTCSRRAKISGTSSSVIQWIWKHWRVVQSMIPRPKSSAIDGHDLGLVGGEDALDDLRRGA